MERIRACALPALIALSAFMTALDGTVVTVALPAVQRALRLSVTGLEWVVAGYLAAFSGLLLLGGRLTDLYGRRRVLAAGTAAFTAASVWAALAGSGAVLIAARAVQGAGAALVLPAALAVVVGDLPARRQPFAVGLWTAALATALALGPLVGGLVTEHWGWRGVFLLNVPLGVAAGLLAFAVPPPAGSAPGVVRRLDLPGAGLSAAALACLAYALVEGGSRGVTAGRVPLCLAVAAVAGAGFLAVERRSPAPLVAPGLFRSRSLSGGTAVQVLWGIGVNGVFFFTPLFLQRVLDFSPARAGLVFLPLAGALVLATPPAQRLSALLGTHRVVAAGMVLVSAGLLVLSGSGAHATYGRLQPGLLLIGAGSALTTALTTSTLAGVPPERTGMASGVVSSAREVSGVLGIAVVGALLAGREQGALRAGLPADLAFADGYAAGLRLAAALVFCGAAVTALLLAPGAAVSPPAPPPARTAPPPRRRSRSCRRRPGCRRPAGSRRSRR